MQFQLIFAILSFVFGAVLGSFLNVVIIRRPEGLSLGGRSHCPSCRRVLGVLDLFPIVSYLALKGKCRGCQNKISPRYLIVEALTGSFFLLAFLYFQPANFLSAVLLVKVWMVLAVLICVFIIDLEHFLILDEVILVGGIFSAAVNLLIDVVSRAAVFSLSGLFVNGLLAALLAALPFFLIWYFSKGEWMGFGDVKLALFLGLALGWPNILVALFLAVLLGGFFSTILLLFTKSTLKTRLPFGTFLSVGTAVALFFGPKLLVWYLAILGF